jgi:hypothetical protein
VNVVVMEILDAARRSVASGETVRLERQVITHVLAIGARLPPCETGGIATETN